ncbi:MAG: type III pantothenate kinase [Planctomycetota bacterium]
MQGLIAVDVGNTAAKVAIQAGPGPLQCQSFRVSDSDWTDEVFRWIKSVASSIEMVTMAQQIGGEAVNDAVQWLVASVNRAASERLRSKFEEQVLGKAEDARSGAANWKEFCYSDLPITVAVSNPGAVGIDRLLSAFAASKRFAPPFVVVDAGSAVTVDLVSSDEHGSPVFCGGAIMPGLALQAAALRTGTEGLRDATRSDSEPATKAKPTAFTPGRNTLGAIETGIAAAIVGAIERLASDYLSVQLRSDDREPLFEPSSNTVSDYLPIVMTGGDAYAVQAFLRIPHEHCSNLVCRGLLDMAETKKKPPVQYEILGGRRKTC